MKKYFLVLASTALISSAFAQTPTATPSAAPTAAASTKAAVKNDARRDALNEKHITDLHAKLHITASEEALWKTVADTMRDNTIAVDKVVDQREAMIGTATAVDDLTAYGEITQAHADSVKKLVQAFTPLYAAMTDAQKKIADGVFTQRETDKKVASAK